MNETVTPRIDLWLGKQVCTNRDAWGLSSNTTAAIFPPVYSANSSNVLGARWCFPVKFVSSYTPFSGSRTLALNFLWELNHCASHLVSTVALAWVDNLIRATVRHPLNKECPRGCHFRKSICVRLLKVALHPLVLFSVPPFPRNKIDSHSCWTHLVLAVFSREPYLPTQGNGIRARFHAASCITLHYYAWNAWPGTHHRKQREFLSSSITRVSQWRSFSPAKWW